MGLESAYGIGSLKPGVCTSSTRPASPFTGQTIYDTTVATTLVWNGTAWIGSGGKVLQIVSTTLTTPFTATTISATIITGLTVSITPSSSSNKIYVSATINGTNDVAVEGLYLHLQRDSTPIAVGTGGTTSNSSTALYEGTSREFTVANASITILDSPATTSAITYAIYGKHPTSATFYINRTKYSSVDRFASTITVMEISA